MHLPHLLRHFNMYFSKQIRHKQNINGGENVRKQYLKVAADPGPYVKSITTTKAHLHSFE